jgi:hypothetical protein
MEILHSYNVQMWAAEFLIVLFLVGGLLTFAVGAGLILWNDGVQRMSATLNRWVSTRRWMKQAEIPHDTMPTAFRYRRPLAAFFVIGACYSLWGLCGNFNEPAFAALLSLNRWPSNYAAWLAESIRWFLLVGNAVAIVAGIMLAFFPGKLAVLEAKGGQWISDRKVARGADAMNTPLDKWVAAHPQIAGGIMVVVGVLMIADFGVMWTRLA